MNIIFWVLEILKNMNLIFVIHKKLTKHEVILFQSQLTLKNIEVIFYQQMLVEVIGYYGMRSARRGIFTFNWDL